MAACPAEISTPRGVIAAEPAFAEDFRSLSTFLRDRLSPGERLYVYPYGPGYNFLLGHPSPSPYLVSFPTSRTLTTDAEFSRIQDALESQQTRYVVVPYHFRSVVPFLFRAGVGSSNIRLENYLIEHYRRVHPRSQSAILERKGFAKEPSS